ncbi:hypothetical protein CERZMDRAFT_87019 [Cercospora zeae-maydis SCOH1-5]|uniref:Uncharacterized protein n=1 Tax=Cercospora zeae-maydis SCOH1-5 TaxID=717836 RepID=A0A6A6F6B1_9PEZI|nr:hypothetical protein CERZMDRAFT_87019 [Cercospora zeae-maydis SCOH1-5]
MDGNSEEQQSGKYASYVPHELSYSAEFEDALMSVVLNPPASRDGIRVISEDSTEQPMEGVSVRMKDVALESLPIIAETDLPLALDDPRRIYASPVPGVKLTHPGGYLEGGPGLDPDMDTFPEDFFNHHPHARTNDRFAAIVDQKIEEHLVELQDRMRKREQAIKENGEVEKKLQELVLQHAMELKVHKKLAEDRRAKREAKEKRRAEREVLLS